MIHMISYLKKRVDPLYFDIWPSPLLSAQFWLDRLVQAEKRNPVASIKQVNLSTVGTQTEWPDTPVDSANVVVTKRHPHRGLPGYNTILQCGATTIADDTALGTSTAPMTYNTPTSGRIQRLFGGEDTNCWQISDLEDPPKENVIPMDTTTDDLDYLPKHSSDKPAWNPLIESTSVVQPLGTISSNVTSFDSEQKMPPPPHNTKSPFEVFQASYLHYTQTSHRDEQPHSDKPSATSSSTKTPFEIFHDSYIQYTQPTKPGDSIKTIDPRVSSATTSATGHARSLQNAPSTIASSTKTPFEIFHDSYVHHTRPGDSRGTTNVCASTSVTTPAIGQTRSMQNTSSVNAQQLATVTASNTPFNIFHDSYLHTTVPEQSHSIKSANLSVNSTAGRTKSIQNSTSPTISSISTTLATKTTSFQTFHDSHQPLTHPIRPSGSKNTDPRLARRADVQITSTSQLDDSAICDLLEEKLAAIPKATTKPAGNFTEFDSPTRFIQFLNKRTG